MQPVHAEAPDPLEYVPWGQGVAVPVLEYVPGRLGAHCPAVGDLYVLGGQLAEQAVAQEDE